MAIEAAFAEAHVDYDFCAVSRKTFENHTEEFRIMNSRRRVYALMLPNVSVMTEGSAMLFHNRDVFPQSCMLPESVSRFRAQHDRWLAYSAVNVYGSCANSAVPF